MTEQGVASKAEDNFWRGVFSANPEIIVTPDSFSRPHRDRSTARQEESRPAGELWLRRLFQGSQFYANTSDKMVVLKNGVEIDEIPIERLNGETIIGRHPEAHLQLEAHRLNLYHVAIRKRNDRVYLEVLDPEFGALLDRRRLPQGHPFPLRDGSLVDIPGYQLRFHLSGEFPPVEEDALTMEPMDEVPAYFYNPPPPPPSPLLTHLIDNHGSLDIWSKGTKTLRVVDIIDETADVKTFRLVGETPMLFSYLPGQFVTLLLNIDGIDVERSYSMSSSPSRPHVLELTIKRVPGGLVSNWMCDHVKLGQRLSVKGPAGKFSCFNFPSSNMLFIGAGSGLTPVMAMARWIIDTSADVNVKFIASFKTPADIIFRKEFELMSCRHRSFQVALTLTAFWGGTESWTGYTGRISKAMLHSFVPDVENRHIFLCGPEPFADEVKKLLRDMNFDLRNLHSESFGSGRVAAGGKSIKKELTLSEPRHSVRFTKSGTTLETDEKLTLLELAEAHGIEIDYACRAGSCGECEVKFAGSVMEKAEFDRVGSIKEGGKTFACCSHARSNLEIDA